MENTLKITNVLSDPTRFYIYEYIVQKNNEVTVLEIAEVFEIHPNVARLHLSKLEDVKMLISSSKKTGKGGRPSRVYQLSHEEIGLSFPFRDYKLLSQIAIEAFSEMGEAGKQALYKTGEKFGKEMMQRSGVSSRSSLSKEERLKIMKTAAEMIGLYPEFRPVSDSVFKFQVNNCPFKDIAKKQSDIVCLMHEFFLKGMFEALFEDMIWTEEHTIMDGCGSCLYKAELKQA
ncbi:helix-turn-helix transcriptional regulator [Thalassobacillus pellis]|uniref:helix-turn-helix transcriptional regulator n=1 Tax=Thalassobacillus pellis TaxID=748008 RepID=UPI00195F3D98|nr:helix-turn-helix domain-containing protein [Thalassobacillus pellis]MBM7552298.1 putative ArsR family transcriptional regulator [Thalassobacillus pellis]